MPVASTTPATHKDSTPHCFCFKPAATLQTEDVGIVYECHYTDLDLWLHLAHDPLPQALSSPARAPSFPQYRQSPRSPSPQQRTASASAPEVCSSHSSPSLSSNKDKKRPAIQDIVNALTILVEGTKNDLPPYWGGQRNKSAVASSEPALGDYGHGEGGKNTRGSLKQGTTMISRSPPATKKRRRVICGFHMHGEDWQAFKPLIWNAELTCEDGLLDCKKDELECESIYARRHHEMVLRHPRLHGTFLRKAHDSVCYAHLATVGRWVNWEREILHGRTSPAGGAPVCFCGTRMRLSSTPQHESGIRVDYFCALRLDDSRRGCSRVMDAAKWVSWQSEYPIHPLVLTSRDEWDSRLETEGRDGTSKLDCAEDNGSVASWGPSERTERRRIHQQDLDHSESGIMEWAAPLYSNLRRKQGDSGDRSPPQEVVEDEDDAGDTEDDDEDSEAHCDLEESYVGTPSTEPFRPRMLVLPGGLVDTGGRIEHKSRRFASESRRLWPESLEVSRLKQLQDTYAILVDRLCQLNQSLAPARIRAEKSFQSVEVRLMTWQGSTGRLREYAAALRVDGCDNPTLRCRLCKEGTLSKANKPCFHLAMCDRCIREHPKCVVCHSTIDSSQRIFWG
ncbi:hypothetical protein BGZ70_000329 [Mortierella alpina]|uniref:RING-type domain-containing protein n=1 Tax=Mortierella alpina TaxID=64518 RepID=A0A9P6JCR3_MORAP|nr:hypothetical protein BGZ70_000329 [Mortierella alpina]